MVYAIVESMLTKHRFSLRCLATEELLPTGKLITQIHVYAYGIWEYNGTWLD